MPEAGPSELVEQHTSLAEALHLQSRHAEANFELRSALLLAPHFSGSTYDRLGVLLVRFAQEQSQEATSRDSTKQLSNEAVSLFRRAVSLAPASGDAHYHLAATLSSEAFGAHDEAAAVFAAGARVQPRHAGLVSNAAFALIGRAESSRAEVLAGGRLLQDATAAGVWRVLAAVALATAAGVWRVRWQHPTTYDAQLTFAAPRWARKSFECLLQPLEGAANAMAEEAVALLPLFAVQAEGLATPAHGWREYNVLRRCVDRSAAGRSERANLTRTCEALEAMVRGAGGGFELLGASFSAMLPG